MSVLFVCYANQCRSPMAEALLKGRLRQRPTAEVDVGSAGLLPGGVAAAPLAQDEMARRGLDLGRHLSRQVNWELLEGAQLILPMTRRQITELAVIDPAALPRTLTLPEAVRRGQSVGKRQPKETLSRWAARLTAERTAADVLKAPSGDDIADPMGGPAAGFARTADLLDGLIAKLVALAFP